MDGGKGGAKKNFRRGGSYPPPEVRHGFEKPQSVFDPLGRHVRRLAEGFVHSRNAAEYTGRLRPVSIQTPPLQKIYRTSLIIGDTAL